MSNRIEYRVPNTESEGLSDAKTVYFNNRGTLLWQQLAVILSTFSEIAG